MFLIFTVSNNTVNINVFKLLKHSTSWNESMQDIYCVILNVFESIYSISIFNVCNNNDDTDGDVDANVCDVAIPDIALQSLSLNIINYQSDAADLKRVYSYFKTQLSHMSINKFSLSKHILNYLNTFSWNQS